MKEQKDIKTMLKIIKNLTKNYKAEEVSHSLAPSQGFKTIDYSCFFPLYFWDVLFLD